MIVSSFGPGVRYPLYSGLSATLLLMALLAGMSLWGSFESRQLVAGAADAWLQQCVATPAEPACQQALSQRQALDQQLAAMLLLQSLSAALILIGALVLAYQGYHVLVRRTREALELCSASARERARDELGGLVEGLAELNARHAGLAAQKRWQQQLGAELARRNDSTLRTLQQVMRLLSRGDISEFSLQRALQLLDTGLGARTVALRLHSSAREALAAGAVVATRGEPRLLASLPEANPGARDTGPRVVPPTEAVPAYTLILPISLQSLAIGTLVAEFTDSARVENAQIQLAESFAQIAALAIASLSRSQGERRVALMEERSAIAAELHDSLAQSLSFMKIQVARLQAGLKGGSGGGDAAPATVHQAAAALREGLSAAYHEVRELIAAFRVRMGPGGLRVALQDAIDEFAQRSNLEIFFDDRIGRCQLEVNEEFHTLQLVREAITNAVRHAGAGHVWVAARYSADEHHFSVTVDDDGNGQASVIAPGDHYGRRIMSERAQSLRGTLNTAPREGGGSRVVLSFAPQRFPGDAPQPDPDDEPVPP